MSVRTARLLTALFFAAYLIALTWPGATLFNRVRPLVLGLPFNFAMIGAWVIAGGAVLWALHRAESRHH